MTNGHFLARLHRWWWRGIDAIEAHLVERRHAANIRVFCLGFAAVLSVIWCLQWLAGWRSDLNALYRPGWWGPTLVWQAGLIAWLLGMAAWASWTAFQRFDPAFTPELARKAGTVGESLHAQMTRALDYGIPVDRMPGIDALFADEMRAHGDIAYIVLTAADGRVIASAGTRIRVGDRLPTGPGPLVAGFHNTTLPLLKSGETVARLNVGIDNAYLAKASVDLMLDVMSVLVVSVLITFEVLLLVVNHQGYLNLSELLARAWTQGVVKAQAVVRWAWLAELAESYTMDEQRSQHHNTELVDRSSRVEFF